MKRRLVVLAVASLPWSPAWRPNYRAATRGLIHKAGYQPHPERHASPTPVWEPT